MGKNRDKARTPKGGKGWFYCGCDKDGVTPGGKCKACGSRDVSKKRKFSRKDIPLK